MTTRNQNLTESGISSQLVGWKPETAGRGTLTLLTSCLATIMLCTWIVIHPRICKRKKHRLLHKLVLWLKTIVAPEFIAVEAAQEWTQARRVAKEASVATNGELDLVQAFYIGMFGLQYRTLSGTKIIWPNQFVWLMEQGLLSWKDHEQWGLSVDAIKDKGNSDTTAKLFAASQVIWFVAQSVMRVVHDLPLSPLEAMTLSYVPLFAVAYFYWWTKPRDIETPSEIDLPKMTPEQDTVFNSLALDDQFDSEGTDEQESIWSIWALTPRLFEKEALDRAYEKRKQEQYSQEPRMDQNILPLSTTKYACLEPSDIHQEQETVLAHWDPELYHSRFLWPLCCLAGISFPALHLISWNSAFPTLIETWLWRTATIASMVSMLLFMQFERLVVRWCDPWTIVKILLPSTYMVGRMVLLVGTFAALRATDPGVYDTYPASTYWLHIM
ncbi:unnamed protein product [Aureobasidium vineae]|uniref:Uncharacterized protein n=1 Tax=Aureobasidium vineae TaxID=2773715 RepID=A0A9N8JEV1_9PEZI|nr:unnamed protein product [Aureobasidium vineae]